MQTVIEALRELIGTPDFYTKLGTSTNYSWDYGAMIEYFFAGLLLCIVVSSIFKLLLNLTK